MMEQEDEEDDDGAQWWEDAGDGVGRPSFLIHFFVAPSRFNSQSQISPTACLLRTSYTHTAIAVSITIVSPPLRRLRISPIASDLSTPAHACTVSV
ncbi:hypothetical protein L1987_24765 [Smallanthus sonchifolius]|uniref:Uncharacterized protein n=1 Tax=Smallanthus sonchifolius TaxID=185202 RepID=A0ACB9ILJ1_9ASTR|nr:hypothetical protein L1987_24765 [Smallanthus sonchifolius]